MGFRDADFEHVRPSQEEVAALLYSRLVTEGGQTPEEFTNETTPTVSQVEKIIDLATGQLLDRVGVPIKDNQLARGKYLATIYTASLIAQEVSPEQRDESAAYTGLVGEYAAQINDFIDANRHPLALYMG